EFRGAAKIRGWSDREFIGKQVSLDVDTVRRRGNETVITVTVGGNGYNGPGHFTFKSDGNRISRMMIRA
ncbi:MAG TPA: nuclear transport factor 2 family protein, partial [Actinoplanes sp.]|nr:nuclear transport factor 2 family protein [Actinoplanes sp.]